MSSYTLKKAWEYYTSKVNRALYVIGAQGEKFNTKAELIKFIEKRETLETNRNKIYVLLDKMLASGLSVQEIECYDCSGLIIKLFLETEQIKYDTTANGLYKLSKAISKASLENFDFVCNDGNNNGNITHIGIYLDGNVIHSKGRSYGVIKEKLGASTWKYFCRYPYKIATEGSINIMYKFSLSNPMMKGDNVKALQEFLNSVKLNCGNADGSYGKNTDAQLKEFIKTNFDLVSNELKVKEVSNYEVAF